VETAAISYRVADFLKQYPPFHVMEESDLLDLARHGRVRFFEKHQYVLAQGSSRLQVLVIQQGTVLVWDEKGDEAKLLDVRGAGDLLGIDQMDRAASNPYAARSVSDLLVYGFPTGEFNALVDKYPLARQFVSAYTGGTTAVRSSGSRDPHNVPLVNLAKRVATCAPETSIREAARKLIQSGSDVLIVESAQSKRLMTFTSETFLAWIAQAQTNADSPIGTMLHGSAAALHTDATVAEGVLALARGSHDALVITSDGTPEGIPQGFVTSRSLGQTFGERPLELLAELERAQELTALRSLNKRARLFVLRLLSSGDASDWLAAFTSLVDIRIARQIISSVAPTVRGCWCLRGSAGRAENLVNVAPEIVLIAGESDETQWMPAYHRVTEMFAECGYLPAAKTFFEPSFYAASLQEWRHRFNDWVTDPILERFYEARPLFDLRPVYGDESLLEGLEGGVIQALNREFLHVVANDCLSTIPPLTFFKDAVVDEMGEEAAVFRLKEDALRPLIDVGRVFGLASRKVFRSSTLDRFAIASKLLPSEASIFDEAAEALRVLLWQQGRVGISQESSGSEIPPALLGPYDRQFLKKAFRSILRLIEFTGDLAWLKRL
jgi:CBS domain-containing protein